MDETKADIEAEAVGVDAMLSTIGVLLHRAGGKLELTPQEIEAFHREGPYEILATTNDAGNAELTLQTVKQEEVTK